ncbi:molybdate ABC transporter substrate-binding protein [Psychromonas sp. MME2]|uniref:molybdate ABC transporter substrate-binding protein n=1 Tax=unclassified Psychromonas TaxID=2614957 RepID=UPI00339CF144
MKIFNKKTICALIFSLFSHYTLAQQVMIAVAGNFYKPLQEIAAKFEQQSGHKALLSVGSTGKLYAQIVNGAPFDIFIAADQLRPAKLAEQHLALKETQFTYAQGQLVLWSKDPKQIDIQGKILSTNELNHLAIANPKTAPYGAAAITVLKNMGLYEQLTPKLVLGQNVGQSFQQISSGAVKQGIIALSQILDNGKIIGGSSWIIPTSLYSLIKQDAIVLNKGKQNSAAIAFLDFLKSPVCLEIIRSYGYKVGA